MRSDVVARSAGCSYQDFVANVGDRNGHAYNQHTIATACTKKLTVGAKLGNRDFSGLRNFAELKGVQLKH